MPKNIKTQMGVLAFGVVAVPILILVIVIAARRSSTTSSNKAEIAKAKPEVRQAGPKKPKSKNGRLDSQIDAEELSEARDRSSPHQGEPGEIGTKLDPKPRVGDNTTVDTEESGGTQPEAGLGTPIKPSAKQNDPIKKRTPVLVDSPVPKGSRSSKVQLPDGIDPTTKGTLELLEGDLKSSFLRDRVKACEVAGKLGAKAAPLARQVCARMLDESPEVAKAATAAFQNIRPDLHKHLTRLLKEKSYPMLVKTLNDLSAIQDKDPAIPILNHVLWRHKEVTTTEGCNCVILLFTTIRTIEKADPNIFDMALHFAYNGNTKIKLLAYASIGDIAEINTSRREKGISYLLNGLAESDEIKLVCLEGISHLVPEARQHTEAIQALIVNGSPDIRKAAKEALARIEDR